MLCMSLGRSARITLGIFAALALASGGVFAWVLVNHNGVGFSPEQPVPFSHARHLSTVRLDCRYCHPHVEIAPSAGLPTTKICMGCHTEILVGSPKLAPLVQAYEADEALVWVGVNVLADTIAFDHASHVAVGVACETCHGRVDQMHQIAQFAPLDEAWCMACHRQPERRLRSRYDVFEMGYAPADGSQSAVDEGQEIKETLSVRPPLHCSGCHR